MLKVCQYSHMHQEDAKPVFLNTTGLQVQCCSAPAVYLLWPQWSAAFAVTAQPLLELGVACRYDVDNVTHQHHHA